ncbi:MAG: ABC transporter permease [Gemmatimonadaceae bacterium]|nr:ABC transporter permease [Gemmatimonadaceae bacterium]
MALGSRISGLFEGVVIAIDALRANRVRAALTILGIAIGVFVVVVMSAAIHGINRGVASEFEKAGPTTFFVNRFPISLEACDDTGDTCKWRNNPPLRVSEAASIRRLPSIQGVNVSSGANAAMKYFDRQLPSARVSATTSDWLETSGGDIIEGRNFTPAEDMNSARVLVINEEMKKRLFGEESDPLGKVVTVNRSPFEVIGVFKGGGDFMSSPSPRAYVPFSTGSKYLNIWIEWIDFTVKPRAGFTRDEAVDDVVATLRSSRGLRPSQDNTFAVFTQDKLFETWGKMTGVFFLVMLTLSGIGLIVGGVGVVAIMMISVTERTREIGVRKALGATRGIILWQFLVEAATLTAIGAMVGLVMGALVSLIIRSATPLQASIPPGAIVAALLASGLTGILFGLFPASRAARLDPIDALRYE